MKKSILILFIIWSFLIVSIFLKPVYADELTDCQKISLYVKIIEYCDTCNPFIQEREYLKPFCRKEQMAACLEFLTMPIPREKMEIAMEILRKHGFKRGVFYDTIDWKRALKEMKRELND